MDASRVRRIISTAFMGVGLILLIVAGCLWRLPQIPKEYLGETTATITDIAFGSSMSAGTGRRITHEVMISYDIDGQNYQRAMNYYSSSMYTGQQIDIQYDTRDHGRIIVPQSAKLAIIILIGMGVIFCGLGALVAKLKNVPIRVNGRYLDNDIES